MKEKVYDKPKRFFLLRKEDVSGVSGVGRVADGVMFDDGLCVVHWRGWSRTTSIFNSIREVVSIHGHNGKTSLEWID